MEMFLKYCEINQNLFLFLIQRYLSAENSKLNAAKMKKYGIFTYLIRKKRLEKVIENFPSD